jgi:hypothetical protein
MRKVVEYFVAVLSVCAIVLPASGQEPQQQDVVLRAMNDELIRNMDELRHPEFDQPFFIMYGVHDQKIYSMSGSLGSLVHSTENKSRFKSTTRLLVGDYGFNDESLEDNLNSAPTTLELELPEDDDYMGIRRSFWSSTDKVYRDAARHFQRHQQTVKESGKLLAELPHRSFAKGKPVTIIPALTPYSFDKILWEEKVRDLSAIFLNHPEVLYSSVVVNFKEGHQYLVNSEGVMAKIPIRNASFLCVGQLKGANGEIVVDQVVHQASSPDQFPTTEKLKEEIEHMISRIKKQLELPTFDEEYSGPVLLSGPIVADVFSSILLGSTESIIANNFIVALTGLQFSRNNSMDTKIGKMLLSPLVTIKARPTLKNFNGVDLLGAFQIDDEGMVPEQEVAIVENGVLKTLLNDRTITHESQSANGFSSGPGVLEISLKEKLTEKVLKDKLIKEANDQGLDYALIIRQSSNMMGIMSVYRVSVEDGKEELLRNAIFGDLNQKMFRRILGGSETYLAHNLSGSDYMGANQSQIVSYIVPSSILVQEMEVKPFDMPTLHEEEYVSNPLQPNR